MCTRPMSFFFTLTLLFGVMTIERSWASEEAASPNMDGRAAVVTPRRVADDLTNGLIPGDVFSVNADTRLNAADEVRAPEHDKRIELVTVGPERPRDSRCIVQTETLQPEIARLIATHCVGPMEQDQYCGCVGRFVRGNSRSGIGETRGALREFENRQRAMRSVGYQFLLEKWADEFGSVVLTSARIQGKSNASEAVLPQQCDSNRIFNELRLQFQSPTCPNADKKAFQDALANVFRINRVEVDRLNRGNGNIFELIKERSGGDTGNLIGAIERLDRFYQDGSRLPTDKTFVDCFSEPADKRALALLPSSFRAGDQADVARRESDLATIKSLAQAMSISGDGIAALDNPVFGKILMIFPGIDVLLKQGTTANVRALGAAVTTFANQLYTDPRYRQLAGDKNNLRNVSGAMRSQVQAVQTLLTAQLNEMNGRDSELRTLIESNCNDLKEDLLKVACDAPGFVSSTSFMSAAFADARERSTLLERDYNSVCTQSTSNVEDSMTCLRYHYAQCRATDALGKDKEALPQTLNFLNVGVNLANDEELKAMAAASKMAEHLSSDENDVTKMVCEEFNAYVKGDACKTQYEATPNRTGYWQCALNPNLISDYLRTEAGQGDAGVNSVARNSLGVPGLGSRGPLANLPDEMDFIQQDPLTPANVNVAGGTNLTSTINSAVSRFNSQAIVAPTTLLDIDGPTSSSAASESRETVRPIAAIESDIAGVDAQIASVVNSPETDATRRELEALRSEMRALREEQAAATRAAAEAARTAANRNAPEGDEEIADVEKRVVSGSGRGGISRGPASEGFNTGSGGARSASDAVGSSEFRQASVDSTFGASAATRGAVIRDSQNLPSVQSNDANNRIALRVGDQSYAVKDVETVVVPAGTPANDQTIRALILQAKDRIVLDAEQRAMVEVWDDNSKSSRVVYVRINGLQVEFLELNAETTMPQVRSTLADLQSRLSAGRGAASVED